jgi:hypothetical protein
MFFSQQVIPNDIWALVVDILAYDGQHLLRLYETGGEQIRSTIHTTLKRLRILYPNKYIVQRELPVPSFLLSKCAALESLVLEGLGNEVMALNLSASIKHLQITTCDEFSQKGWKPSKWILLNAPGLRHLELSSNILLQRDSLFPALETLCANYDVMALWGKNFASNKMVVSEKVSVTTSAIALFPRTLKHLHCGLNGFREPLSKDTFPPTLESLTISSDSRVFVKESDFSVEDGSMLSFLPRSLTKVSMHACPLMLNQIFKLPQLLNLRIHEETTLNLPIPRSLTKLRMDSCHLTTLLSVFETDCLSLETFFPPRLCELRIDRSVRFGKLNRLYWLPKVLPFLPKSLTVLDADDCVRLSQKQDILNLPCGLISLGLNRVRVQSSELVLTHFSNLTSLSVSIKWDADEPLRLPDTLRHLILNGLSIRDISTHLNQLPVGLQSFSCSGEMGKAEYRKIQKVLSVLPRGLRLLHMNIFTPIGPKWVWGIKLLEALPPNLTSLRVNNSVFRTQHLAFIPRSLTKCDIPIKMSDDIKHISKLKKELESLPSFLTKIPHIIGLAKLASS